ncbi:MAG: hypothetical protein WBC04_21285 [Candidatus Acidiferrales bacterium]
MKLGSPLRAEIRAAGVEEATGEPAESERGGALFLEAVREFERNISLSAKQIKLGGKNTPAGH